MKAVLEHLFVVVQVCMVKPCFLTKCGSITRIIEIKVFCVETHSSLFNYLNVSKAQFNSYCCMPSSLNNIDDTNLPGEMNLAQLCLIYMYLKCTQHDNKMWCTTAFFHKPIIKTKCLHDTGIAVYVMQV